MSGTKIQSTIIQNVNQTNGVFIADDIRENVHIIHDAGAITPSLSIAVPPTPVSTQRLIITSRFGISALTLTTSGVTPASLVNPPTYVPAGGTVSIIYSQKMNAWYTETPSTPIFTSPDGKKSFIITIDSNNLPQVTPIN